MGHSEGGCVESGYCGIMTQSSLSLATSKLSKESSRQHCVECSLLQNIVFLVIFFFF